MLSSSHYEEEMELSMAAILVSTVGRFLWKAENMKEKTVGIYFVVRCIFVSRPTWYNSYHGTSYS
jgi:hypothetical protein